MVESGDLVTAPMSVKGFDKGRKQACPGSIGQCRDGAGGTVWG